MPSYQVPHTVDSVKCKGKGKSELGGSDDNRADAHGLTAPSAQAIPVIWGLLAHLSRIYVKRQRVHNQTNASRADGTSQRNAAATVRDGHDGGQGKLVDGQMRRHRAEHLLVLNEKVLVVGQANPFALAIFQRHLVGGLKAQPISKRLALRPRHWQALATGLAYWVAAKMERVRKHIDTGRTREPEAAYEIKGEIGWCCRLLLAYRVLEEPLRKT